MTSRADNDDVRVAPRALDPWLRFKYGNVSATPRVQRAVAPK